MQACAGSDLNGATQVGAYGYSVNLAIEPSDRNRLSMALRRFAAGHDLQFFDFRQGSLKFSSRRMAVFSPRGLHAHADMITGNSSATRSMARSPVILVACTFANHDEWPPVLRALDTELRTQWPDETGPESLARVKAIDVPDLESWKRLTPGELHARLADYSYREEARPLIKAVVDDFRELYGHIEGVEVNEGPGIYHGGSWTIEVRHPFIFDRRSLPQEHLGVWVHTGMKPEEIPQGYKEEKQLHGHPVTRILYEKFVDENAAEIRRLLKQPDMRREEMLSALVGMPWERYQEHRRKTYGATTAQ